MRALLAAGAAVNAADHVGGWTALIWASKYGRLKTTRVLLAAGANVNAANQDFNTALTIASGLGYVEVVRALLAAGASVNAGTVFSETALMKASHCGSVEVVRALLASNANKHIINGYTGETAYSLAAGAHDPAVTTAIRALLDLAP